MDSEEQQHLILEVNFLRALLSNNTDLAISYIGLGANINLKIPQAIYNLANQSLLSNSALARIMTEIGSGYSYPIHVAVQKGNKRIVRALLNKGADIDALTSDFFTPLVLAVNDNLPDMLDYLLRRAANPNKKMANGITSLHIACSKGHVEAVQKLLAYKSNPEEADDYGETPLMLAVMNGNPTVVKLLIDKGSDVNQAKPSGATPLFLAAQRGHLGILRKLLAAGAHVNVSRRTDGCSPLQIAATKGNKDVVMELINAGADIYYTDFDGKTAIDLAKEYGHHTLADDLDRIRLKKAKSTLFKQPPIDHISQAKDRYAKKQYAEAMVFFKRAIPQAPIQNKAAILCNIGHCYFALKEYTQAAEYYRQANNSDSSNNTYNDWHEKAMKKQTAAAPKINL
jgi:ankyrin repeat protein